MFAMRRVKDPEVFQNFEMSRWMTVDSPLMCSWLHRTYQPGPGTLAIKTRDQGTKQECIRVCSIQPSNNKLELGNDELPDQGSGQSPRWCGGVCAEDRGTSSFLESVSGRASKLGGSSFGPWMWAAKVNASFARGSPRLGTHHIMLLEIRDGARVVFLGRKSMVYRSASSEAQRYRRVLMRHISVSVPDKTSCPWRGALRPVQEAPISAGELKVGDLRRSGKQAKPLDDGIEVEASKPPSSIHGCWPGFQRAWRTDTTL